jgi:hypothetical protein
MPPFGQGRRGSVFGDPGRGSCSIQTLRGLFGRTVGVGYRTAMFTDQGRCGFLMERGATGCGIMTAVLESLFRKRVSQVEVPYLGSSLDPPGSKAFDST